MSTNTNLKNIKFRTFEIAGQPDDGVFVAVAATETPVLIDSEKGLEEVLLCNQRNIRLGRLKTGTMPVLLNHNLSDPTRQVGNVVNGRVVSDPEIGNILELDFTLSPTEPLLCQKVKEKVVRNVSIGYITHGFQQEGNRSIVEDWEPVELSIVCAPKDIFTKIRSLEGGTPMPEEKKEERAEDKQEEQQEENKESARAIAEDEEKKEDSKDEKKEEKKEEKDERGMSQKDLQTALNLCYMADIDFKKSQDIVFSSRSLDEVVTRVSSVRESKDIDIKGRAILGGTQKMEFRNVVEEALLGRLLNKKMDGQAGNLATYSLLEISKRYMEHQGISLQGLDRMQIATRAMHATSDFPNLLANVAQKYLLERYQLAPSTYEPFIRTRRVRDFKDIYIVRLGDIGQLLPLKEGQEYKRVSIGETGDSYRIESFGEIISFSRQALINDDLSAFEAIPMIAMQRVQELKNDLFWDELVSNPVMYDSVVLFHTASHGNLAGSGAGISLATLSAARLAMRSHKGHESRVGKADGVRINVDPVWLVVPPELETEAEQMVSPLLYAADVDEINVFSRKLKVMVEPKLSDDSLTAWYIFSEASKIPMAEMAVLEGQEAPRMEHNVNFYTDALDLKVSFDCAVKMVDYRGFYKNPGT